MGMSQMCTGADHYFRPSKPHSGKLCDANTREGGQGVERGKSFVSIFWFWVNMNIPLYIREMDHYTIHCSSGSANIGFM